MSILCVLGFLFAKAPPAPEVKHPVEHRSYVQVGPSYTHASIKIHDQPLFHGNLGGLQGYYEYKPWNNLYAGVKLAWKEGSTKGAHQTRDLLYIDTQERFGYTFASNCKRGFLSLFTGLGYRHMFHQLKQHHASSIDFYYNELYIPVGFLADYFPAPWFSLGLNFTWMPQVYPTVKIAPLKGARWILRNQLSNFFVEVPFTFFLTKSQHYFLVFKPFYEYWEDGHTTAKLSNGTPLGLPGNDYNFWGAEFNFGFAF